MFYYQWMLTRKGQYSVLWKASNGLRLAKKDWARANIKDMAQEILHPAQPLAVRLQAMLLYGTTRIYQYQVNFSYDESQKVLLRLRSGSLGIGKTLELQGQGRNLDLPQVSGVLSFPEALNSDIVNFSISEKDSTMLQGKSFTSTRAEIDLPDNRTMLDLPLLDEGFDLPFDGDLGLDLELLGLENNNPDNRRETMPGEEAMEIDGIMEEPVEPVEGEIPDGETNRTREIEVRMKKSKRRMFDEDIEISGDDIRSILKESQVTIAKKRKTGGFAVIDEIQLSAGSLHPALSKLFEINMREALKVLREERKETRRRQEEGPVIPEQVQEDLPFDDAMPENLIDDIEVLRGLDSTIDDRQLDRSGLSGLISRRTSGRPSLDLVEEGSLEIPRQRRSLAFGSNLPTISDVEDRLSHPKEILPSINSSDFEVHEELLHQRQEDPLTSDSKEVLKFMKVKVQKGASISFPDLLSATQTPCREVAANLFLQLCVLTTKGFVSVKQSQPFASIVIKRRS